MATKTKGMFKKLLPVFFVLGIATMFFDFGNPAHTSTGGSPGGNTNSPGDGQNCGNGGCHGGGSTARAGMITSDIPSGGWVAGQTYTITVSAQESGRNKYGFELTCEDSQNAMQGTFASKDATTKLIGTNATHTSSGNGGIDSASWVVDWTAPTAGAGTVTFYASVNATDSMSNTSGDMVFHSSLAIDEDVPTNIAEREALSIETFPNPVTDQLTIGLKSISENVQIELRDMSGRLAQDIYNGPAQSHIVTQIDSKLSKGLYTVIVTADNRRRTHHIVLQR